MNETRLQLLSTFNKGSSFDSIISNYDIDVNSNIRKNYENDTKYSIDPDVESQMKALNERYGTKKKGENPVMDIYVPERSSKDIGAFVYKIL